MKKGYRWAVVTFCTGITCSIIGHYIDGAPGLWFGLSVVLSFSFSMFGAIAVDE